jgi:hypothetical protein
MVSRWLAQPGSASTSAEKPPSSALVHHDRDDHLRLAEFTAGFGSCLAARMRRRNAELCSTCSGATSRVQIRRIAQAVTEKVEGEADEDHRDDGEHEPGIEGRR